MCNPPTESYVGSVEELRWKKEQYEKYAGTRHAVNYLRVPAYCEQVNRSKALSGVKI